MACRASVSKYVDESAATDVVRRDERGGTTGCTGADSILNYIRFPSSGCNERLEFEPAVNSFRTVHLEVHHPIVVSERVERLVARARVQVGCPNHGRTGSDLSIVSALTRLGSIPIQLIVSYPPGVVLVVMRGFSQGFNRDRYGAGGSSCIVDASRAVFVTDTSFKKQVLARIGHFQDENDRPVESTGWGYCRSGIGC